MKALETLGTADLLDTAVHAVSPASRSGSSRMYELRPADPAAPLPAFEAGAHIDVHIGLALVRQYSLLNSFLERFAPASRESGRERADHHLPLTRDRSRTRPVPARPVSGSR